MPQKKKRKRQKPGRFFSVLILVFAALVVFEGKVLISIFGKETLQTQVTSQVNELLAENITEPNTEQQPTQATTETNAVTTPQQTEAPLNSPAVVPEQNTPVDESYFSDAVFIGDSRMEGFRNQSGITQGTFLTGVGMTAANIFTTPFITQYNEQITVFQAMYNNSFKKIYVMIGTNDLGEPDFDTFKQKYQTCLRELQKQAPDAILYVLSVAYVEESKVTTGDYVNNANIAAVNEKILELCEENDYHYVNINEVLSNGNQALIEGASSDGVHIYDRYCKIWLEYLMSHYVPANEEPENQQTS